jgi:hypothetical protein
MLPVMRRLKIDRMDLEQAFEGGSSETIYYLDTESGEVLAVDDDSRQVLEQLREEAGPDDKLEDLLLDSGLPDWQKQAVEAAAWAEESFGTRVVEVPPVESRDSLRDMAALTQSLQDAKLRAELERALDGRGAFRRFKDVLGGDLRTREDWFEFKRQRLREHMAEWLASLDIEPVWEEPPPPPPQPPLRQQLLEAVLLFVRSASRLAGVKRIALIGSLTTLEPRPSDVDLLVTVTEDLDLAPLAKAARQLSGRAMQTGGSRGGDVFLANVAGNYLGRTCPWKECGPGIRMSCQAQHCGQRHYLYDDLQNIQLESAVIQAPPIELWPAVVPRVEVPADVEEVLLKPIRAGMRDLGGQRPLTKPETQTHE